MAVTAVAAASIAAATACGHASAVCITGGTRSQRAELHRLVTLYELSDLQCLKVVSRANAHLAATTRGAILAISIRATDENHLTLPLWRQALVAGAFSDMHPTERPWGLNTSVRIGSGKDREWGSIRLGGSRVPMAPTESTVHLRSAILRAAARHHLRVVKLSIGRGLLPAPRIVVRTASSLPKAMQELSAFELTFGGTPRSSRVDGFFIELRSLAGKPVVRIGYVARVGTAYSWRAPS
jgi:hypothetical protein